MLIHNNNTFLFLCGNAYDGHDDGDGDGGDESMNESKNETIVDRDVSCLFIES